MALFWRKIVIPSLLVALGGCGLSKEDETECSNSADCARSAPTTVEGQARWCVARANGQARGYCERLGCEKIGGWCGTGGKCVAADTVDRVEDSARIGHCEKTDCIASFCPLLLTCSTRLWCERPLVMPSELPFNQAR